MHLDLSALPDSPLQRCLSGWLEFLDGDPDALRRVLAEDVVLHSPVLFKPQHGRDLVAMYLTGASMTFVGEAGDTREDAGGGRFTHRSGEEWDGGFRYVRTVFGERDAVLEFETMMDGKFVNGVDMITCDDDGQIVDFKVMVRPLQAVEAVRAMMFEALQQLQG